MAPGQSANSKGKTLGVQRWGCAAVISCGPVSCSALLAKTCCRCSTCAIMKARSQDLPLGSTGSQMENTLAPDRPTCTTDMVTEGRWRTTVAPPSPVRQLSHCVAQSSFTCSCECGGAGNAFSTAGQEHVAPQSKVLLHGAMSNIFSSAMNTFTTTHIGSMRT